MKGITIGKYRGTPAGWENGGISRDYRGNVALFDFYGTFKATKGEPIRNYFKCNKCSAVAEMGDRLATIDMGRKLGAAPFFFLGGELDRHLTQCGLGRGLPPYQVAS